MYIPSAQAERIRNYQSALFNHPTEPKNERIYVFYLLLRPCLLWLREELRNNFQLKKCEAESEVYILCANLFEGFDYTKSSIIPYLTKHIPWKAYHLQRKLNKQCMKEEPCGLITIEEEPYETHEEYYWDVPNVLLSDRYIGKCFTNGEKSFIVMIITCDSDELTKNCLAKKCDMDRKTIALKLLDLREVFETWRT